MFCFCWNTMESMTYAWRIGSASTSSSTIFCPPRADAIYIVSSLRTSHISAFHHRVVIESWIAQTKHVFSHLTPVVSIASMFASECHSIPDMVETAIVGCKSEKNALTRVADIREMTLKFCHISGSGCYVSLWLMNGFHRQTEMSCCGRHNLHQSTSTCPRPCLWVEATLLIALRCHQPPVHSSRGSIALEIAIIVGDDTLRTIQEG